MSYFFVAAAAITIIGGVADAQQQRQAGKANQQIEENNARLADDQARDANIQGARESQKSVWRMRALAGSQRAAIAAQGIDSEVGTASDLQDETYLYGAADRSAIGLDAARKAWGFQGEALNSRNQGAQARWQGSNGANITILKSVGSALSIYGGGVAGGAKAGGGGAAKAGGSIPYTHYGSGGAYNYNIPRG